MKTINKACLCSHPYANVAVTLDGQPITHCTYADAKKGHVVRFVTNADGLVELVDGDTATELLAGDVHIKMSDGYRALKKVCESWTCHHRSPDNMGKP